MRTIRFAAHIRGNRSMARSSISTTIASPTLVAGLLPQSRSMGLLGFLALAFAGSMVIALAGKITVPFWPCQRRCRRSRSSRSLRPMDATSPSRRSASTCSKARPACRSLPRAAALPISPDRPPGLSGRLRRRRRHHRARRRPRLEPQPAQALRRQPDGHRDHPGAGRRWIALVFGADKAIAWGVGPSS
jgi:hypothetical protein